jgi:endonuclease YncB( thermonuclease family)
VTDVGRIWRCEGTVVKIRDGDTFLVDLDLGWTVRLKVNDRGTGYGVIRVLNLWCPELNEAGGPQAKVAAQELLPLGSTVTITSRELDSFGRSLANVALPDGRDFATVMIAAGHGTAQRT